MKLKTDFSCRTSKAPFLLQQAIASSEYTPCILEGICAVTADTTISKAAGGECVTVFDIDLSEYIQPPSNDSPLMRFLKNEDRLGEMSSSPWVARTHKLWRIGRSVRSLWQVVWVVPSCLRSAELNDLFVWIYIRSRLCILLGTVGPLMKFVFYLPLQLIRLFVPRNILLKLELWTYAKPPEEGAWLLNSFYCFFNH